jgi:hypothetical protein
VGERLAICGWGYSLNNRTKTNFQLGRFPYIHIALKVPGNPAVHYQLTESKMGHPTRLMADQKLITMKQPS